MREIEFKMERPGLVEAGQEVEITEHEALSGCSYIIEPPWPCQPVTRAATA